MKDVKYGRGLDYLGVCSNEKAYIAVRQEVRAGTEQCPAELRDEYEDWQGGVGSRQGGC